MAHKSTFVTEHPIPSLGNSDEIQSLIFFLIIMIFCQPVKWFHPLFDQKFQYFLSTLHVLSRGSECHLQLHPLNASSPISRWNHWHIHAMVGASHTHIHNVHLFLEMSEVVGRMPKQQEPPGLSGYLAIYCVSTAATKLLRASSSQQ